MKKLLLTCSLLLAFVLMIAMVACNNNPQEPETDPAVTTQEPTVTPTEPVDVPTDPVEVPTDPVDPDTDPVEVPTDPVDPDTDPVEVPTDPVDPPEPPAEITDTTIQFKTDVNSNDIGTDILYSDLFNLFDMSLPQGGCVVEEFNGEKVYAMHMINSIYYTNEGFYYFKLNNVKTTLTSAKTVRSFMIVRGYKQVVSDWLNDNQSTSEGNQVRPIREFHEDDGLGRIGGAGIYAAIVDGQLHIMVKYYDETVGRRVGNKFYTIKCDGTELTIADDGSTVYILVGDKLMATIELSGSITYEDIREINCSPGYTFAEKAVVTLANGIEETIENTLVADTVLSQIGIASRGNATEAAFLFSSLEYGPFSAITTPEFDGCVHEWVEASCTAPKICSLCNITVGDKLGHNYVDGTCSRCGDMIVDTGVKFTTNVNDFDIGTTFDQTDLANLFELKLAQGGCVIEDLNGEKVYAMHKINGMYYENDGYYYFKTNNLKTTPHASGSVRSYMIVRGYWTVNSDTSGGRLNEFYADDKAGYSGGAGIYAAIMDGKLHIIVKYYDSNASTRVGNKLYTLDCEGTELTLADDGSTVYILVGDKLMGSIELTGSITYDDIRAENCSPANTFAAQAVITLANGTLETIENTLIADSAFSQIGIACRGNETDAAFLFSSLEYGPFSDVTIPESGSGSEDCEHTWVEATCTTRKVCTACGKVEGDALGHDMVDATCTAPKSCSRCELTEGVALGHDYANGTCTRCGDKLADMTNSFAVSAADETDGTLFADSALKDYFTLNMKTDGCIVSDGKYRVNNINEIYRDMDGMYFVTLKDASSAGSTKRAWLFVRGYHSVKTSKKTVTGYYEDDGNSQVGPSGIYARIEAGELYIMMKYADASRKNGIGIEIFTIPCEGDDLTIADDGGMVYILVDNKLYAMIKLSGTANMSDVSSSEGEFAAEATLVLSNGTTKTFTNTLIANTCNSQIGVTTRGGDSDFYFSSVEVGKYSSIEIPEFDVCFHNWVDATCTAPKTCSVCGAIEGDVLPHTWIDATCTAPKTCSVCHATEGVALGHDYVDGTCSRCGDKLVDITVSFSASATDETEGTLFADSALKDYFTLNMKQAGCVVSEGQYHMTATNEFYKNMDGMYFVTLKDASASGTTDRAWLFVRGYHSVKTTKKTVTGYYEDDGNSQVGPSGIYARIEAGELYIMMKYADSSRKNGIGIQIFTIACEGDDLTMADDGSTVYILVDGKTYATIQLNGTSETGSANSAEGSFAAEATITLADGTTKTFTDTLIANTCKSQIGLATRGCDFYFTSVEVGGFSAFKFPDTDICEHNWVDATCAAPKTCSVCGATEGDALDHTWVDATCTASKTCSVCGATEGDALGHDYVAGVCSRCEEKDPNYVISDTDVSFTSNVNDLEVGKTLDQTDLANFFVMNLRLGGCTVEDLNGNKVYAMQSINEMLYTNTGLYYFKTNNVLSTPSKEGFVRGYMIVRGYQQVISDATLSANTRIRTFYETDGGAYTGGAGIYAAMVDGKLHLILKYYNSAVNTRVGNKVYTLPFEGTELTMADDGSTVYILVDGKLLATIALSGSVTYEDIQAENCNPGNTFAASAVVTLADGTVETIENTLIADTPLSQIAISNRGGSFLFSSMEYGPFSKVTIPEMEVILPPEEEQLTDITDSFSASAADETDGTLFADSALKDYFTLNMKQAGCVVSEGQYHMTAINEIYKNMDGMYFVTLKDASASGTTDRAWLFVRGYHSVKTTKKTVTGYYEDDGNSQVGPSGIYARIEAGELYIMMKYADSSRKNGIGIQIFTIACEGDDLTMADDGSTVYILVDGKTYATIQLNGTSETGSANSAEGSFAAEATITLADGTTKTFTDTLIANTCKSQIGLTTRGCDFYFTSVEVGGFSAIEIPELIVKE